jgi:hypothetical protein
MNPAFTWLGVECDGATYHSSAFARERDKIRQSVLEGLGWTLLRVWSTDWWTNKAKALNTIDEALTSCLELDCQKRKEQTDAIEGTTEEIAPATIQLNGDDGSGAQQSTETDDVGDESSMSGAPPNSGNQFASQLT